MDFIVVDNDAERHLSLKNVIKKVIPSFKESTPIEFYKENEIIEYKNTILFIHPGDSFWKEQNDNNYRDNLQNLLDLVDKSNVRVILFSSATPDYEISRLDHIKFAIKDKHWLFRESRILIDTFDWEYATKFTIDTDTEISDFFINPMLIIEPFIFIDILCQGFILVYENKKSQISWDMFKKNIKDCIVHNGYNVINDYKIIPFYTDLRFFLMRIKKQFCKEQVDLLFNILPARRSLKCALELLSQLKNNTTKDKICIKGGALRLLWSAVNIQNFIESPETKHSEEYIKLNSELDNLSEEQFLFLVNLAHKEFTLIVKFLFEIKSNPSSSFFKNEFGIDLISFEKIRQKFNHDVFKNDFLHLLTSEPDIVSKRDNPSRVAILSNYLMTCHSLNNSALLAKRSWTEKIIETQIRNLLAKAEEIKGRYITTSFSEVKNKIDDKINTIKILIDNIEKLQAMDKPQREKIVLEFWEAALHLHDFFRDLSPDSDNFDKYFSVKG